MLKRSLTVGALAAVAATLLTAPPAQTAEAAEQIPYKIIPVVVTTDAIPDPNTAWNQTKLAQDVAWAANWWETQSGGKLDVIAEGITVHHTKLDTKEGTNTLTNKLLQEATGKTTLEMRNTTYVFFLPQSHVTSASGGQVAASSYNNRFPANGFGATGGSVVMGTNLAADHRNAPLLAHEIGHSFATGHANSFHCGGKVIEPRYNAAGGLLDTGCVVNEYTDYLDIMSNVYGWGAMNTASASNRGFTQANEVLTIKPTSETVTYNLKPWGDRASNEQKSLKIAGVSGQPDLYIELRNETGLDVGQATNGKAGVRFVQWMPNTLTTVVLPPESRYGVNQAWRTGETFVAAGNKYQVKILEITPTGARVEVGPVGGAAPVTPVETNTLTMTSSHKGTSIYNKDQVTFTANLKDSTGKPVANETVELYNGSSKYVTLTTNAQGVATWTLLKTWYGGIYNLVMKSEDDNSNEISFKHTVAPQPYTLTAQSETNGTMTLTSPGIDNLGFGNLVVKSGTKVIYNQQFYNGKLTLPAADVKHGLITWQYPGDRNLTAGSGQLDLRATAVAKASVATAKFGTTTTTVTATVTGKDKAVAANMPLRLVVADKTINATTNAQGVATWTLPANLNVGVHSVQVNSATNQIVPVTATHTITRSSLGITAPSYTAGSRFTGGTYTVTVPAGATGTLKVVADGTTIYSGKPTPGQKVTLPTRAAGYINVQVTYTGDVNINSYSRSFGYKQNTQVTTTKAVDRTMFKTPQIRGVLAVYVNNKLVTTQITNPGATVHVLGNAYQNNQVLRWTYTPLVAGYNSSTGVGTFTKKTITMKFTKATSNYVLLTAPSIDYLSASPAVIKVNGNVVGTMPMTSNSKRYLLAQTGQTITVTYPGTAVYDPFTATYVVK